jgi:excisionase family DNA binding protein
MHVENVEPRLLRVDEVAARLDCNPETVRRMARRGELPALRLGSGTRSPLRIPADELVGWLNTHRLPRETQHDRD